MQILDNGTLELTTDEVQVATIAMNTMKKVLTEIFIRQMRQHALKPMTHHITGSKALMSLADAVEQNPPPEFDEVQVRQFMNASNKFANENEAPNEPAAE